MQYRNLCGEKVSVPGFGVMHLPTKGEESKNIDTDKSEEMFDYALENGVNCVDIAYPYHREENEESLDNYLEKRNLRDEVYLAAKLPIWKM